MVVQKVAGWPAAASAVALLAACGSGGSGGSVGVPGSQDRTAAAPTWAKSFGGAARDQANAVEALPGGGFVVAGSHDGRGYLGWLLAESGIGFDNLAYESDMWIQVLDELGDIVWQRTYGLRATDPSEAVYMSMAAVDAPADGVRDGIWLAGISYVGSGLPALPDEPEVERGSDLIVTRLGANNELLFSREYDSGAFPAGEFAFPSEQTSEGTVTIDISPTADGGALVAADVAATIEFDGEPTINRGIFVLKLDATGGPTWSRLLPFSPETGGFGRAIVRDLPDGAVVGYSVEDGMEIVRLAAGAGANSGVVVWRRTFTGRERIKDIVVADADRDGAVDSIALAGTDDSTDGFLIKLGLDGGTVWRRNVGSGVDDVAVACRTPNACDYVTVGEYTRIPHVRITDADGATVTEAAYPSWIFLRGIQYLSLRDQFMVYGRRSQRRDGVMILSAALSVVSESADIDEQPDDPSPGFEGYLSLRSGVGDDWLEQDLYAIGEDGGLTHLAALTHDERAAERAFAVLPQRRPDRTPSGYVVAGTAAHDIWLLRLDAAGAIEWQRRLQRLVPSHRSFPDSFFPLASLLAPSDDGGFVVGGGNDVAGGGDWGGARLVKLDAAGIVQWSTRDFAPEYSILRAVDAAPRGGYYLAGHETAWRSDPTLADFRPAAFWLASVDANGIAQSHHLYMPTTSPDVNALTPLGTTLTDMRVLDGGGVLVAGHARWELLDPDGPASIIAGFEAAAVARLDPQGGIVWSNTYHFGRSKLVGPVRIAPSADGGVVAAVSLRSADATEVVATGRANVLLFKIDAQGAVEWTQRYGGLLDEAVHDVEAVPGGYIVSGLSDSVGVYTDAWVLRVGPDGRIAEGCHADRGRESVVARPLPLTRVPYELRGDGESATPRSVVVVDTNVAAATPSNVVTARQCVGAATHDAGPSATPRSLTVRQSGTSTGVVTSVPGGIVCGTDGGGVCSAPYADGSLVTLRVDFGSIDRFVQWGPGCEPLTGGSDDVCLVRLDADKTIDVYFNTPSASPPRPPLGEFTLSVSVDRLGSYVGSTDGSFGCQVSGGQPRTCSVRYPAGRIVDLYAAPLPGGGALFENWAGDCSSFGAQPSISLTMNRDYSCRAQFVTAP